MTGTGPADRRGLAVLWAAVAGACAVCCAGPLLAMLSAVGLTAGFAAIVVPSLVVVAVAAGTGMGWVRHRAQARCHAQTTQAGPIELEAPTIRPSGADDRLDWMPTMLGQSDEPFRPPPQAAADGPSRVVIGDE